MVTLATASGRPWCLLLPPQHSEPAPQVSGARQNATLRSLEQKRVGPLADLWSRRRQRLTALLQFTELLGGSAVRHCISPHRAPPCHPPLTLLTAGPALHPLFIIIPDLLSVPALCEARAPSLWPLTVGCPPAGPQAPQRPGSVSPLLSRSHFLRMADPHHRSSQKACGAQRGNCVFQSPLKCHHFLQYLI